MLQVQMDEFGGPDVLRAAEVADPVPGPGQVLIEVEAAGITFVETQVRAGKFRPPPVDELELPIVLGNGVEGRIVEVGDQVARTRIGEHVVSATGGHRGYAELVTVHASDPFLIPNELPPGHAVAMLADGRTALAQMRVAELRPGDRVLILAAAGGVGTLLTQLARASGAVVAGTAGGQEKVKLVSSLGADHSFDYTDPTWADAATEAIGGVDVLFDGVGGQLAATASGLLVDGGRRVTFGAASGTWTSTRDGESRRIAEVRGVASSPEDNRTLVEQALTMAGAGRLQPIIGQSFDFRDAAGAHRAIEARSTLGKTILVIR